MQNSYQKNIFIELKNLFLSHKLYSIFFLIVLLLSALFESASIGLIFPVVDIIQSDSSIKYIDKIYQFSGFELSNNFFIISLFLSLFIIFLLSALFLALAHYTTVSFTENILASFQSKILEVYLDQKLDFYVKNKSGDLIQKLMVHTVKASEFITLIFKSIKETILLIVITIMLLYVSIKATLIFICMGLVIVSASYIFSKIKVFASAEKVADIQSETFSMGSQILNGIKILKAYSVENFFKSIIGNQIETKKKLQINNHFYDQMPLILIRLLTLSGILTVLFSIFLLNDNPSKYVSYIALFGAAGYKLNSSIGQISNYLVGAAINFPSIKIVFGELNIMEDSISKNNIKEKSIFIFDKSIKFENVCFHYNKDQFNLKNIYLEIKKGSFTSIIGESGSGKSTIVDLIMNFYQSNTGNIFIDDSNINYIDKKDLRKNIGYVSQDSFIISGSINSNIAFGIRNEFINHKEVVRVAKIAEIHEYIYNLPDKYDTILSEQGVNLSGGQKQRIVLSRALYSNKKILILDEATSNLDKSNEEKIISKILKHSREHNITVINVAHSLSSVIKSDQIIVMDQGKIIEIGNHKKLLNLNAHYSSLYNKYIDNKMK